jgi:hypothetical protein
VGYCLKICPWDASRVALETIRSDGARHMGSAMWLGLSVKGEREGEREMERAGKSDNRSRALKWSGKRGCGRGRGVQSARGGGFVRSSEQGACPWSWIPLRRRYRLSEANPEFFISLY